MTEDAPETQTLLGGTGNGRVVKSDRSESLRKRNGPHKKTKQSSKAEKGEEEEEEEEMNITPLLEDETEPKKNK